MRRLSLASPYGRGAPIGGGEGPLSHGCAVTAPPKGEPRAQPGTAPHPPPSGAPSPRRRLLYKFQSPALLRETALPKSRWPPTENVRRNRALHKNEERISIPTFRHIFPGYLRRNTPCHRGFGGFQIPPYEMNKNPPGGMGKIK